MFNILSSKRSHTVNLFLGSDRFERLPLFDTRLFFKKLNLPNSAF